MLPNAGIEYEGVRQHRWLNDMAGFMRSVEFGQSILWNL